MKRKLIAAFLCVGILAAAGCSRQEISGETAERVLQEVPEETLEETPEEMPEEAPEEPSKEAQPETTDTGNAEELADYTGYAGYWSVGGVSSEEIIADGGAELTCEIENGNEFTGYIFTQQSGTERLAYIEDIAGTIENDELYFPFTDDGWGGQGTLYLLFSDEKILVEVFDYQLAEDNAIGYGINGSYEMIRSVDVNER